MNDKKVIWITGASSGIGRSLALKFAKEGWTVAASDIQENLLHELDNENENIHSFPLDVTNAEKCKIVFNNILNKFNDVEICFFAAGINDPESEKSFNLISIKKIMDVNYFGVMNSINSIYEHYNKKKVSKYQLFLLWGLLEDYLQLEVIVHQSLHLHPLWRH